MITIMLILLAAAGGFVGGVLVGRNNKQIVEGVVTKVENVENALKK